MPAIKIPPASDAIGSTVFGAGGGVVFVELVVKHADASLQDVLLVLIPIVTLTVSALYFVFAVIIDLAVGKFLLQTTRRTYERALKDPKTSPKHLDILKKKVEEQERNLMEYVAAIWDIWVKRQR